MESEKMSEALRLAELIDNDLKNSAHHVEAAAELRRLHAECESLRAQVEAWTAIAHKHAFILTNVRAALKEAK